jgi:hypothetical protein
MSFKFKSELWWFAFACGYASGDGGCFVNESSRVGIKITSCLLMKSHGDIYHSWRRKEELGSEGERGQKPKANQKKRVFPIAVDPSRNEL